MPPKFDVRLRSFGRALACLSVISTLVAVPCEALPFPSVSDTPLPQGSPMLLASASDGGVWFGGSTHEFLNSESPPAQVGYITSADTFKQFPFSTNSELRVDGLASDGNAGVWFVADDAPMGELGHILPDGQTVLKSFTIASYAELGGLALGSDGNLWMTSITDRALQPGDGTIFRISPAGHVTAFRAGLKPGALPESITAGPEGALWFLDRAGRVGRITTAGRIREFPIGRPVSEPGLRQPHPIVASTDGALWFVVAGNRLGRMTPAGHVRVYAPPRTFTKLAPPTEEATEEAILALAAEPKGRVLFTRERGAVLSIGARGHIKTLTTRLESARGGVAIAGRTPT